MGGRIGEMRHTNRLSTGAKNDIEQATEIARAMVCEYGMSELGPISFGRAQEEIFLGREIAQHRDYSEATAIKIDDQVRKIIDTSFRKAEGMIHEYGWALEAIAAMLLERESIDGQDVKLILGGKTDIALAGTTPEADDGHQEVLRPQAPPARPGFLEGGTPQPA